MTQEWFTPAEVATILGVSAKTVARWCREGKVAHTKTLGGHRRIDTKEVDRLKELTGR